MTRDIVRSYHSPRAVVRGLNQGSRREARILVYLIIACGLFFVAQWPAIAREAHLDDSQPFEARMAGALFGVMFMAPLVFYAIGAVLTLLLRVFTSGLDGFDVRLALFWALLVVSPLSLLQGLVSGIIGQGLEAQVTGFLVFAVFVAVLIAGLRVAIDVARTRV